MKVDERSRPDMERLLADLQRRAVTIRRRRRAGRTLSVLVSALLIAAALVWSTHSLSGLGSSGPTPGNSPSPQGEESTYSFEFLRFSPTGASPGSVAAEFRVDWSGPTFPGVRACVLTALDSQGNVVGRNAVSLREYSLAGSQPETSSIGIAVDGEPATAEGRCGPRLDTGDPYDFEFKHTFVRSTSEGASLTTFPTWSGQGAPGVVDCRFSLLDPDGTLLASRTTTGPTPPSIPYWQVEFKADDIRHALPGDMHRVIPDITCVPYVDGHEDFPPLAHQTFAEPSSISGTSPTGDGWDVSDATAYQQPDGWTVTFRLAWEDGVFPGERSCTTSVAGGDGQQIASDQSQFEADTPQSSREINVPDEPSGVSFSCGPRLDTPVAYVISDAHPSVGADGVGVAYHVEWPAGLPEGGYPGTNQCIAALVQDGKIVALTPFGLSVGPGDEVQQMGDASAADTAGASAVVQCEPFDGDMAAMVDAFQKGYPSN